jgi:hypothetical protein
MPKEITLLIQQLTKRERTIKKIPCLQNETQQLRETCQAIEIQRENGKISDVLN